MAIPVSGEKQQIENTITALHLFIVLTTVLLKLKQSTFPINKLFFVVSLDLNV